MVGVGAVVVHEGRVLLIRRGKEPLRGRWLIPGGTVEWGETLHEAVVRETLEETGLTVRPVELLAVVDRIHPGQGGPAYHFVILDYLCAWVAGEPRAASDAEAVALVPFEDLGRYDLPSEALEIVWQGIRRCASISSNTSRPEG